MPVRVPILLLTGMILGFGLTAVLRPAIAARRAARLVVLPNAPELRCVDLDDPVEDSACPDASAALLACTVELAEVTAERPTSRLPFPEVPEAQEPDAWTDNLAEALDRCGIPASFEVSDCEEYPCAAALRVAPGDEARVTERWAGCAALTELHLAPTPTTVYCPDGTTEIAHVVLTEDLADWAPAIAQVPGADPTLLAVVSYGRRVESTLQMWTCRETP